MRPKVSFTYRNHRGEVARRHVIVDAIEYLKEPGYGYKPGWFISGLCLDKGARRSFSFDNIDPESLSDNIPSAARLLRFPKEPSDDK